MRTGGGSCIASTSQASQDIDGAVLEATNIELQYVFDSDAGELLHTTAHLTAIANPCTKYGEYDSLAEDIIIISSNNTVLILN